MGVEGLDFDDSLKLYNHNQQVQDDFVGLHEQMVETGYRMEKKIDPLPDLITQSSHNRDH